MPQYELIGAMYYLIGREVLRWVLIVFQLRPTPPSSRPARLGGTEKDAAAYVTPSQMWWSKIATWLSLFKALALHLLMLLEIWGVIEQIPSNPTNGSISGHWLNVGFFFLFFFHFARQMARPQQPDPCWWLSSSPAKILIRTFILCVCVCVDVLR